MENENSRFGAAGSNASDLGSMGALYPILTQLGGGSKAGQMAMDYAQQMYPDAPKADPWEAALQYFLAMGQAASEPGATLLGYGVRAMQAPADYLAAKKTEKRETDRARMQTALQLAPSLKAGVGKVTYRPATAAELAQYGATAGQMGSDGKFYDLSKTASTSGNDLKPFSLINSANLEDIRRVIPTASVDPSGNILLTDTEAALAGVRPYIGQKISPETGSEGGPNSPLAKLYQDLEKAVVGSPEALALQAEIDALVTKSGFDK